MMIAEEILALWCEVDHMRPPDWRLREIIAKILTHLLEQVESV